jgi:hypothetical protein
MIGTVLLIASILAGWLWDAFGPTASFLTGRRLFGICSPHHDRPHEGRTKSGQ